MTSQTFNTADELRRIIAEGRISEDALQAMTGIPPTTLRSYLFDAGADTMGLTAQPQALSTDEGTRLSILASQLVQGLEIDDDERLQAILEGLTAQFHLTLENVALLAHVDLDDVETALRAPDSLPPERKYRLALRVSYIANGINQARER